jgi:AcrR family transcriptional regulator
MTRETPAKAGLDRETIARAALRQLDDLSAAGRGARDFSARKLASTLDVTSMALYWHARNKDELLDWAADLVVDGIVGHHTGGAWDEQLLQYLVDAREQLLAHPAVIELLATPGRATSALARFGNDLSALIARAGFAPEDTVRAFRLVLAHLVGSLCIALSANEGDGRVDQWLAAVPPDELAAGGALVEYFSGSDPEEFVRTAKLLLQGIELALPRP